MKPESPLNNLSDEVSLMGRQGGSRGNRARREDYQENNIDMHQTQVGVCLGGRGRHGSGRGGGGKV